MWNFNLHNVINFYFCKQAEETILIAQGVQTLLGLLYRTE